MFRGAPLVRCLPETSVCKWVCTWRSTPHKYSGIRTKVDLKEFRRNVMLVIVFAILTEIHMLAMQLVINATTLRLLILTLDNSLFRFMRCTGPWDWKCDLLFD
jgi:hypothetical protein